MATLPTTTGSKDSWGAELNTWLGVSLDSAGKPNIAYGTVSNVAGTYTLGSLGKNHVASIAKISTGRVTINLENTQASVMSIL
jgi:hypothetical protein